MDAQEFTRSAHTTKERKTIFAEAVTLCCPRSCPWKETENDRPGVGRGHTDFLALIVQGEFKNISVFISSVYTKGILADHLLHFPFRAHSSLEIKNNCVIPNKMMILFGGRKSDFLHILSFWLSTKLLPFWQIKWPSLCLLNSLLSLLIVSNSRAEGKRLREHILGALSNKKNHLPKSPKARNLVWFFWLIGLHI